MGEYGSQFRFESFFCVSCYTSSKIISSQVSSLPSSQITSPSQCIAFFPSTPCCHIVCTACCVMKGQSSGKRASDIEIKCCTSPLVFLHLTPMKLSLYPAHVKATHVKYVWKKTLNVWPECSGLEEITLDHLKLVFLYIVLCDVHED